MKFYDAFSGIGGFHEGIKQAHPDWECTGACEINTHSKRVYNRHFKEVTIDGDIRKVDRLPNGTDILCGGFPCQSFSIAGKRGGFDDTRGTLFFELARLAKASRPRLLFLENVKGLLNHDEGKTFRTILQALDELGYLVEWEVLNSKNFGVPQNRERVFIIGHLGGERGCEIFPLGECGGEIDCEELSETNKQTTRYLMSRDYANWNGNFLLSDGNKKGYSVATEGDGINLAFAANRKNGRGRVLKGRSPALQTQGAIGTVVASPKILHQSMSGQITESECAGTLRSGASSNYQTVVPVLTPDRMEKRQNGRRFKTDGEPMFTLNTQDQHGVALHAGAGLKIRRLTPTECERLQGFPDGWTKYYSDGTEVSDSQRYKMLGNAVTVPVIKAIAERLKPGIRP